MIMYGRTGQTENMTKLRLINEIDLDLALPVNYNSTFSSVSRFSGLTLYMKFVSVLT